MTGQAFSKPLAGHVQRLFKGKDVVIVLVSIYPPLLFFFQLYVGNYTSISEWGLSLLLNAVLTLFLFLILPCYISSMYVRSAGLIPLLFVAAISLTRMNGLPFWPHPAMSWFGIMVNLVLVVYFASFSARKLRGLYLKRNDLPVICDMPQREQ